jgi:hypothetical protein
MFGGRNFLGEGYGAILSATAWSTQAADVGRRRLALARWHDRTFGRQADQCTWQSWPDNLNAVATQRAWWEATVVPLLHQRADQMYRASGEGYWRLHLNDQPILP